MVHEKSIDMLTRAVEESNTLLRNTNNKLIEIKTTQRNTHAFAGVVGSVVGFFGEKLFSKIFF